VTILAYISDASDGLRGGETIFPCVRPRGAPADPSASADASAAKELCKGLSAAFERGERFLSPPTTSDATDPVPCFDRRLAELASDLCEQRTRATQWLGIAPQRGTAVLFLSATRAEATPRALAHMWHGGCRVRAGEKVTLQGFKEQCPTELAPPPEHPHQPAQTLAKLTPASSNSSAPTQTQQRRDATIFAAASVAKDEV
jgi:hypothetical protein